MSGNQALAEAVAEAFGVRAPRTHCVRGHEFTTENTRTTKDGKRRCKECHRQRTAAERHGEKLPPMLKSTMPDNCVGCGVKLVRHRHKGAPPDGTRRHIGKGQCSTCYDRLRRPKEVQAAMKKAALERIDEVRHNHNDARLESFLARRRARGVPRDGRPLRISA